MTKSLLKNGLTLLRLNYLYPSNRVGLVIGRPTPENRWEAANLDQTDVSSIRGGGNRSELDLLDGGVVAGNTPDADLLHMDWDIILILSHLFLLLFLIQSIQIVEEWLQLGKIGVTWQYSLCCRSQ